MIACRLCGATESVLSKLRTRDTVAVDTPTRAISFRVTTWLRHFAETKADDREIARGNAPDWQKWRGSATCFFWAASMRPRRLRFGHWQSPETNQLPPPPARRNV